MIGPEADGTEKGQEALRWCRLGGCGGCISSAGTCAGRLIVGVELVNWSITSSGLDEDMAAINKNNEQRAKCNCASLLCFNQYLPWRSRSQRKM